MDTPLRATLSIQPRSGRHATMVWSFRDDTGRDGCTRGCDGGMDAWGGCVSAAEGLGRILGHLQFEHAALGGHTRPFLVDVDHPSSQLRLPRELLGHDLGLEPWASARAILGAAAGGRASSGPATGTGETWRLETHHAESATHLRRVGLQAVGAGMRLDVLTDGLPLCGRARGGPDSHGSPLMCGACLDHADRADPAWELNGLRVESGFGWLLAGLNDRLA